MAGCTCCSCGRRPREVVERFAEADTYVTNDLVTRWSVREWNVVIG